MIALSDLKRVAQQAFRYAAKQKDVREVEVFASSTDHLLCRLNYTSGIPCHGVEEPKSSESFGFSIRAVFRTPQGDRIGFGADARDLSIAAIRRTMDKARQNAIADPDFVSLPRPQGRPGRVSSAAYHDPALMSLSDADLVGAGWRVINEALGTLSRAQPVRQAMSAKRGAASLGLILSGDVNVFRQRIAIASSHQPAVQTDESASITSLVTCMVECDQTKGTGYEASTSLKKFAGAAGAEAAENALRGAGGRRVPTAEYTVIFGPQPVADLMSNLIVPSLSADAFFSGRSAFLGQIGQRIGAPMLSLTDDGVTRGLVGTRKITCEGLPAVRTTLIRDGILTGLLANHYESQRLARDPRGREKLGVAVTDQPDLLQPHNGFRLSARGNRQFDVIPSIAATNVILESDEPHTLESLLRTVDHGLYIGRIWYTYAINGLRAGDFTCTAVGDSYIVRDGRIVEPLQPNTIRITGNIRTLLMNVIGMTKQRRPIIGWASDEVIYAPDLAVRGVSVTEIAHFMESR